MIYGAMSLQCFHCVDFEVMNSSDELSTFMRRVSGSACPLCGTAVAEFVLLADSADVRTLRDNSGTWNRGAAASPGFKRFFAERPPAPSPFHDVAGTLRAQISGSQYRLRKERCTTLTKEIGGPIAFEEGLRAWEGGDRERAGTAFQVAAESTDDDIRVRAEFQLGLIEEAGGDLRAAVRRYRRAATALVPDVRAAALLYLGISLRKLEDLNGARTAYEDCVNCGNTFARAMAAFRLGTVLEEQGKPVEARQVYELAVGLDADGSDEAAVNLGAIAEAEGRWDRARELWEYAFTTEDEEVRAHAAFNLGRVWEHEGELGKAKEFYQLAARGPDAALADRARTYRRSVSRVWQAGR